MLITRGFDFGSGPFRPAPIIPKLAILSASISSKSVEDVPTLRKVEIGSSDSKSNTSNSKSDNNSTGDGLFTGMSIESRVLFNDHILVILPANSKFPNLQLAERIDCVYHRGMDVGEQSVETVNHPMLSVDEYGDGRWIVRCPIPPVNYSAAVGLRGRWNDREGIEWVVGKGDNQSVQLWDMLAYEAVFDGEDIAVVFVKGLQLKSDRESEPTPFRCQFRKEGEDYALTTKAITAAQEVIRCPLPPELKAKQWKDEEVQVTVEITSKVPGRSHLTGMQHQLVPSIAKLYQSNDKNNEMVRNKESKYKLCACTMVWNQAEFIREWVMYHAWLGVERWFVYDNNSDDELKEVITEMNVENYNVTRHAWPWIKSQEAGFSHCVLRARDQCQWVAFFDVDEFYNFPPPKPRQNSSFVYRGPNALQVVVGNISARSRSVGEIRTDCHNFGPSGLKKSPVEGLMLGYTCRLKGLERHKSIVRPDAVDDSLLNQVHHFKLKKEFRRMNFHRAVINHYKYQVWDIFKAKFYRRVSTYVADWQENQNENSRDRAPGLGTEAIEPPDWNKRFCEVWDTRLRDFVLANLANRNTGLLPWQRSVQ